MKYKFPLQLNLKQQSNTIYLFDGYWDQIESPSLSVPVTPAPTPVTPVPTPAPVNPAPAPVTPAPAPVNPAPAPVTPAPVPVTPAPAHSASINQRGLKIYAPYVDILLWPTINLVDVIKKTGHKFFTLAFIFAGPDNGASWGGVIPLEQKFFIDQVNQIRKLGGDIIISLGGLNGTEIAVANTDVNQIVKIYQDIIDTYQLKYIDFDIEGFALHDPPSIDRRNRAIKIIQDKNPDLKVAYCLPVTPDGLSNYGIDLLKNAVQHNVRVDLINIMTMNYGTYYSTGKDLGVLAIECAKQTYNQSKALGIDCEIGLTPMIGVNDISSEVYTQQHAETTVDFAIKTPWVTLTSNWSLNRDTSEAGPLFKSSQIPQKDYDFLHILRKIQSISTLSNTSLITPSQTVPVPVVTAPAPAPAPAPVPVPVSNNIPNWFNNINYQIGDIVNYNGTYYKCLINHTSISTWAPGIYTQALWKQIDKPPQPVQPQQPPQPVQPVQPIQPLQPVQPQPVQQPKPKPDVPTYKSLSFDGLTDIQIQVILQLTSIFENSTTELAFDYVEDINDGRGYTFGFVGFCSGTYDGSQMLAEYSRLIGDNDPETTKYLNAMKVIDAQGKDMNPSLVGLDNFISYVKKNGKRPEWIQANLNIANKLYVIPSQNKAKELGLKTPLARGQLYDCYLNQGESGILKLIKKTGPNNDELTWLKTFLQHRYDLLAQDRTWAASVDRIKVYQDLLSNNNTSLKTPIKVTCYGDTFIIDPK